MSDTPRQIVVKKLFSVDGYVYIGQTNTLYIEKWRYCLCKHVALTEQEV